MTIRRLMAVAAIACLSVGALLVPMHKDPEPAFAVGSGTTNLQAAAPKAAPNRPATSSGPGATARARAIGMDVGPASSPLSDLRLVNYYPAHHGWGHMWTQWDPPAIQRDFGQIAAMGANGVRLIVQPAQFGFPDPSAMMLARLTTAVRLAGEQGLRVQLTLFDLAWPYNQLAASARWAAAVLAPFRSDPRIAFIELQNEMDARNPSAMAWARALIPFIRSYAQRPVAVSSFAYGAYGIRGFADLVAALSSARPDIFSFHFYGDPSDAKAVFAWAKKLAAPSQLYIGEAGLPTGSTQTGPIIAVKERAQMRFFAYVEKATVELGLPPAAPWTWSDFAPGTLNASSPGAEYRFGLVRLDGSKKPAYGFLRTFFHWLAAHQTSQAAA